MWFEWMSPWWRDTVNVVVAVMTVLATVASGTAIVVSLREANKSRDRLRKERRRLHDLDLIEDLLMLVVDKPLHHEAWRRAMVLRRMLSPREQQSIPWTLRWSEPDVSALHAELRSVHADNAKRSLTEVGWMRIDDHRDVYDAMFDELVATSHSLVDSEE